MNSFIDIYCERTTAALWAEPLNTITNGAFFIAAIAVLFLARRERALGADTGLLIVLLLVIGLGSTLFHMFATGWAQLADTMPILFFQLAFLWIYSARVIGFNGGGRAALLALYLLSAVGFGILPQHWLNGSISYLPAWLFLLGLGVYHYKKAPHARRALLAAALIFTLSLGARTADMALCQVFPYGSHFLWHILNGFVLYLSVAALLLNYRTRQDATAPL